MNRAKIERLRKVITNKQRQYAARQAHIPDKERELKENFAKGRITEATFDLGKSQLEEYKAKTRAEYEEIATLEREIEDEVSKEDVSLDAF